MRCILQSVATGCSHFGCQLLFVFRWLLGRGGRAKSTPQKKRRRVGTGVVPPEEESPTTVLTSSTTVVTPGSAASLDLLPTHLQPALEGTKENPKKKLFPKQLVGCQRLFSKHELSCGMQQRHVFALRGETCRRGVRPVFGMLAKARIKHNLSLTCSECAWPGRRPESGTPAKGPVNCRDERKTGAETLAGGHVFLQNFWLTWMAVTRRRGSQDLLCRRRSQ